ncbi:acyltransferase family protein, partial [Paralcaligenes ginsengisoli]
MKDKHVLSQKYRPDVDGLRGVAVILVLLFHAGFASISGGFVGVDVFFVISGYLITKILFSNCQNNQFDYFKFLSKRFFRLYPSLVTILALTLAFGYLLLSPQHFQTLGQSTIAALFSVSNIVFLKNSGYFAEAASTNALLHTWSLGVEQQFYLLWPLILLVAFRFRAWAVPVVIAVIGSVSLYYSQQAVRHEPSAAYFLTQFRVFEFAIGGLIPWLERLRPTKNVMLEVLLACGIAALLYSAITLNKDHPFPGLAALLPCLAAGLCIFAGPAQYIGTLLRNRLMVNIGLISYSLYLVHWPIIVFYRYFIYTEPTTHEKWDLVVIPFLIAYPVYLWVENRYRRLNFSTLGWTRAFTSACAIGVVIFTSTQAIYTNGSPWRLNSDAQAKLANAAHFHQTNYGGDGFRGRKRHSKAVLTAELFRPTWR